MRTLLNTLLLFACFPSINAQSVPFQYLDSLWTVTNHQVLDRDDYRWTSIGENASALPDAGYRYYQLSYRNIACDGIIASTLWRHNKPVLGHVTQIGAPVDPEDDQLPRPVASVLSKYFNLNALPAMSLEDRSTSPAGWAEWQIPLVASSKVETRHAYHLNKEQEWVLMLMIRYLPEDHSTLWELGLDPRTAEVLYRKDLGSHCLNGDYSLPTALSPRPQPAVSLNPETGEDSYLVIPYPSESPLVSGQQLITNPADPTASPYGWHDTNGLPGADSLTTSGNNARVFLDRNADFKADSSETGGSTDLQFQYPVLLDQEPVTYHKAIEVQLFYQLNTLHDVLYHHGFGEDANFQVTNYSGIGKGNDPLIGLSQFGADRGRENNADFVPSTDGNVSYLRPYLWGLPDDQLLKVTAPSNIAGSFKTASAAFGPGVTTTPISGDVVFVNDGSNTPTFGCNTLLNSNDLKGKIALIDRGNCTFQEKALFAENAGAIGCIICNYEDKPVEMGVVNGLAEPTIPTVSLSVSDCAKLRSYAGSSLKVTLQLPAFTGPNFVDATLDNGVIAHEYFHGVSQRLVGGPATIGCLNNPDYDGDGAEDDGEQMDEGWSDFFALYMTTMPGDAGTRARPIANYLTRSQDPLDGVRAYPYSTDLAVSPYNYYTAWNATVPHGVGAVGNAILWDIYWAMTDQYGYDNNLTTGNGGNNRALALLVESLKLMPCSPGFTDMRTALLEADKLLNNSSNECLIWEAFARRGVGFSARQNNPLIVADGVSAFDLPPSCSNSLFLAKHTTELIHAGDTIWTEIKVRNDRTKLLDQGILVDDLADGATFLSQTATFPAKLSGQNVRFEGITLPAGDSLVIRYAALSDPNRVSKQLFLDDLESGDGLWDLENLSGTGIWSLDETEAHSGAHAWFVPNTTAINDQVITLIDPILVQGQLPVLRFYHRWDTQWGSDAGVLEISTDGIHWNAVDPNFLRSGYNGPVKVTTFSAPDRSGFYGIQSAYIASYLDLRPYSGQEIRIRFRFGSDDRVSREGWWVDDIEMMDLVRYRGTACLQESGNQDICTEGQNGGTFVESVPVSTSRPSLDKSAGIKVYPNPYHQAFQVQLPEERGELQLWSLTGQLMKHWLVDGQKRATFSTTDLPAACYVLLYRSDKGVVYREMLIRN